MNWCNPHIKIPRVWDKREIKKARQEKASSNEYNFFIFWKKEQ